MAKDPLVGHLHRQLRETEKHLSRLTDDLIRHREVLAAIRAAAKAGIVVSEAFVSATCAAHGIEQ